MKGFKNAILVVLVFVLFTVPVYGHKMTITPMEPGVIKVHYADGTFTDQIQLTLYNGEKEEISIGTLDEAGYFHYDTDSEVVYIVADDGMGHRVQWKVGDPVSTSSSIGKWLKIGAIVVIFIGISVIFQIKKKSKTKAT